MQICNLENGISYGNNGCPPSFSNHEYWDRHDLREHSVIYEYYGFLEDTQIPVSSMCIKCLIYSHIKILEVDNPNQLLIVIKESARMIYNVHVFVFRLSLRMKKDVLLHGMRILCNTHYQRTLLAQNWHLKLALLMLMDISYGTPLSQ